MWVHFYKKRCFTYTYEIQKAKTKKVTNWVNNREVIMLHKYVEMECKKKARKGFGL